MKISRLISSMLAAVVLTGSCVLPMTANAADIKYGDVTEDGQIDEADAVLLSRYLSEDQDADVSDAGKQAADVNVSGNPDQNDVLMILEYIARLRSSLGKKANSLLRSVKLTEGVAPDHVTGKEVDDQFRNSQYRLSANLLKESYHAADGDNMMISPLSVSVALAMTANGAVGETLKEMETVLGDQITLDELNKYYGSYLYSLTGDVETPLKNANSIWIKDDESEIVVPEEFLKKAVSYYRADVYKAPFDSNTLNDINGWANTKTDGMIPKMLEELSDDDEMVLLNALTFEAFWDDRYLGNDVYLGTFTPDGKDPIETEFMGGKEYDYLHDDHAEGFIKKYEGGDYSFAAILPNMDTTLSDYVAGLDGAAIANLLESRANEEVITGLPKFSFSYEFDMKEALCNLGMPTAFSDTLADFTGLNSKKGGRIDKVLHKTFIDLNENGTRAAAVTSIQMFPMAAPPQHIVTLDRPFLFMILDEHTGLPIFIGTVENPAA